MPSTRERLRAIVRSDPDLNQTQIAERLGVTRQRISVLADEEGFTIRRGQTGVRGRKPKVAESPPGVTGGVAGSGASPPVAVLLTAADLMARGYTVFLPLTQTASCDIVAIGPDDRLERIVVRKARRAGEEIRYDDPIRGRSERHALILTDEPIQYDPAFGKARAKP